MTVNTQELRELVAILPLVAWSKTRSTVEIPETEDFAGKALHITGLDKQYARRLAAYIAAANPATVSALLDENDALRAELQARQWMPIETCPREHGKRYLIRKDCGPGSLPSISIGFCLDEQKDWHLEDSNSTAEMYGYRVTHWQPLPLPPSPPQGD